MPTAHPLPSRHLVGHDPPQSTSDSPPFFTLSPHDGPAPPVLPVVELVELLDVVLPLIELVDVVLPPALVEVVLPPEPSVLSS